MSPLVEFVALGRQYPGARLVFTGGGKSQGPVPSEAAVSADVLRALGFDVERIVFEDRSSDTFANAMFTRQLVGPQPGETWLLITSAWHMPRAVGSFRAAGWAVLPVPVDYTTGGPVHWKLGFNPTLRLAALSIAVHEWVGLLAYRVLGRTDAWFPAP